MKRLDRRTFLGLGSLTFAGCARESPYLGNTHPPARQQLVCATIGSLDSLDPAKSADFVAEGSVLRALFEGLTSYHPQTLEPMAALATHYETNADQTRFTFYLRGHASPRGIRLPNTDTLREQFETGGSMKILPAGILRPQIEYPPDGATAA